MAPLPVAAGGIWSVTLDPETFRVARDRIIRVFRYLNALNQHRNPAKRAIREQPWFLWFRDLPDHPSIHRGLMVIPSGSSGEGKTGPGSEHQQAVEEYVLRVRRPALARTPNPPEEVAEWLERGWDDPFREAEVHESQNQKDDRGEVHIVRFTEDPKRERALATWKVRREEWAWNERPAREAMKIFEQLYELYGRIEREGERVELILGDGILSWQRADGSIYHPVLLQRLQTGFRSGRT